MRSAPRCFRAYTESARLRTGRGPPSHRAEAGTKFRLVRWRSRGAPRNNNAGALVRSRAAVPACRGARDRADGHAPSNPARRRTRTAGRGLDPPFTHLAIAVIAPGMLRDLGSARENPAMSVRRLIPRASALLLAI